MKCELTQQIRQSLNGKVVSDKLYDWLIANDDTPVCVAYNPGIKAMDIAQDMGVDDNGDAYIVW